MNPQHKEIVRFSLRTQKECLENLLAAPEVTRENIELVLQDVNRQLDKMGSGKKRSTAPRALSPYNHFVKAKLSEVAKQFPDLDNRARMSKVSELWKAMSPAEKASFQG